MSHFSIQTSMIFHSDLALQDDPPSATAQAATAILHFLPFVFVQSSHETSSCGKPVKPYCNFCRYSKCPKLPFRFNDFQDVLL